jgi:hypothetical protein
MTKEIRFHLAAAICALALGLGGCHDNSSAGTAAISGTPPGSVTVGAAYEFRPDVRAGDSAKVSFTITNQPRWTEFDAGTGKLSGSPSAADVGTYANIIIEAIAGAAKSAMPPFTITVRPSVNAGITISGSPAATVAAGSFYSFRPTASAPDGAQLSFTIANKPAWAQFDASTGVLSGTPKAANIGSYAQIVIGVDGDAGSASLAPFSIAVTPPSLSVAKITWVAPDSAPSMAGYHIYYGSSADEMTNVADVNDPAATSYVIDRLASGTWYFAMVAYDVSQTESARSPTVAVTL